MRKAKQETAAQANDPPSDLGETRAALTRKILTLRGMARRCREPICRRARRCEGADFRCLRDNPLPKVSQEEAARRMAAIRRALERRLTEIGA